MVKRKPSEQPPRLSPEAQALADKPHSVNVMVDLYDVLRAKEAAIDERTSSSGIVRIALEVHLDQHPQAESIRRLTDTHFENEAALNALRKSLMPQTDSQQ